MALRKIVIVFLVPLLLLLATRVGAQTANCASAIMSLSPCLSFNIGNSSSSPSSACCSQLASLAVTTPECICDVMNGSGGEVVGLIINRSLAQALPSACNVQSSPLNDCYNGVGSQSGESGDGAYSEGDQLKIPMLLSIFLIFIASYTPSFGNIA